tara:strand:- start:502 stop:612 length:111 start_codon:yes stop_codon:yes gene_type:complete
MFKSKDNDRTKYLTKFNIPAEGLELIMKETARSKIK